MLYSSFWKVIKHSSSVSVIVGMFLAIILSVTFSFFYLKSAEIPQPPSYSGLATVQNFNGVDSLVTFKGEPLTMEVINSAEGDVVSVYTSKGFYTNNPSGHSLEPGSITSILAMFALLAILGALTGFVSGFSVVMLLQRNYK